MIDNLINVPSALSEDYGLMTTSNSGVAVACDCAAQGITCQSVVICMTCGQAANSQCGSAGNQGGCGDCNQYAPMCGTTVQTCVPNTMCVSTCIPAYQCGTCQITSQGCTSTCETACQGNCEVALQMNKALINNTSYNVLRGRTLVNNTGYELKGGRTLVENTGYEIPLVHELVIYNGGSDVLQGEFQTHTYYSTGPSTAGISNGYIYSSGYSYPIGNYNCQQWTGVVYQEQWCSIGPIDFTKYNTLHAIGYSAAAFSYLGAYAGSIPSSPTFTVSTSLGSAEREYTIDISSRTGSWYIIFESGGTFTTTPAYGYISKIWLTMD